MEVGDVLLESVIHDPIRAFERLLGEFSEFEVSSGLGVKGEEGGIKVFGEFVKGFLGTGNGSISHFVIPHFGEGDSPALAYLVEHGRDFPFIGVVERRVDKEVCFDSSHPTHGISRFSGEVGRKCCLELGGGGGHEGGSWC